MSKRIRVKPSKGQSMLGFFMGLIFCFIGFFSIIPSSGLFGFVWTLFAIIITILNGLNAFGDKGIGLYEINIDEDININNMEYRKTSEEKLNELQTLYAKGIITEEEYQNKRNQILEDI